MKSSVVPSVLLWLFCLFLSQICYAKFNITRTELLADDGETLTSAGQVFELGFFSPAASSLRYVGIWHKNLPVKRMVWVANRLKPIANSSGILRIGSDGNLVISDGQIIIWSTGLSIVSTSSVLELLDSGNLVLREGGSSSNGRVIWQSFDHPGDCLLQNMKIGVNINTGEKRFLNSWKTENDPSPGSFILGTRDQEDLPEGVIWNGSALYWRTGQWNGTGFLGIPDIDSYNYLNGFSFVTDYEEGMLYFTYSIYNNVTFPSMLVLNHSGTLQKMHWSEESKEWKNIWEAPRRRCDIYGMCGLFGLCRAFESSICSCLRGFEPKFIEEWNRGNWSGGCVRKTQLLCEKNSSTTTTSSNDQKSDRFLKMERIKLPDSAEVLKDVASEKCEKSCLRSCTCVAYSYAGGIGCMVWSSGELVDVQQFSVGGGERFFLRLAAAELGGRSGLRTNFLVIIALGGIIILLVVMFLLWKWQATRRGSLRHSSQDSTFQDSIRKENTDFQIYSLRSIVIATNNFSDTNKLGQGGFGPVYKGILKNGQEIAVKKLARNSGQGIEELKNEVVLISKLQHRNLVKLLGCCIEREEELLIYEFMPNKSLDVFLFDSDKQSQLDWSMRFNIIEGIARGLLYLHRDSRLRVIHRDLKASNILLDEEMIPKISDFGMARIFGGNQILANTNRVVGTYGYMSPEYAMEGIFSEKSDVFSFGVLLLEIVSSKRNTSFHQDEGSLNLLGYAWKLWNEGKGMELMSPTISAGSCSSTTISEVMRCIHVALLCVQEYVKDRPTMSHVMFMLGHETTRPDPKQPAFALQRSSAEFVIDSNENGFLCSGMNNATMSIVEGR